MFSASRVGRKINNLLSLHKLLLDGIKAYQSHLEYYMMNVLSNIPLTVYSNKLNNSWATSCPQFCHLQ